MENFIDLMSDITYTPDQIGKRLTSFERQKYTERDETILNRISAGVALSMYVATAEETAKMNEFNTYMINLRTLGAQIDADNEKLKSVINLEKSINRLGKHKAADGKAAVTQTFTKYQVFQVDQAQPFIQAKDELGNLKVDGNGNPVYTSSLNFIPSYEQAKDGNGNLLFEQAKDGSGNLLFEQDFEANGEPKVDINGDLVYTTNPIYTNKPVWSTNLLFTHSNDNKNLRKLSDERNIPFNHIKADIVYLSGNTPDTISVEIKGAISPLPATINTYDYTDINNPIITPISNPEIDNDVTERLDSTNTIKNSSQTLIDLYNQRNSSDIKALNLPVLQSGNCSTVGTTFTDGSGHLLNNNVPVDSLVMIDGEIYKISSITNFSTAVLGSALSADVTNVPYTIYSID